MIRRIIICNDGTWNSPDDEDRGKRRPTNISKISRAISPVDSNGISQIIYYDEGVGTEFGQKLIGGITGAGLSSNILQAYRFLAHNYIEGDEIYLFGFSRGAYTSRSLSGFIARIGLIHKDDVFYLPELYEFYKSGAEEKIIDAFFVNKGLNRYRPRIKMIGVFDTVGALGIPFGGINKILTGLDLIEFQFHDVRLSESVDYAYQALGIDERRVPFQPSLWAKKPDATKEMEQRWFVGVHSNIGGGYDPDGLANITLKYIIEKAKTLGLQFDTEYLSYYVGFSDSELRESMTLKYRILGEHIRTITQNDDSNQVIDSSVYDRIKKLDNYKPENIQA